LARRRLQVCKGSCGGVASSSLGGWWRFNVFLVLRRPPPRRRVRFFLTSVDASFCSSQSGFFSRSELLRLWFSFGSGGSLSKPVRVGFVSRPVL
jgi:hypothetical protein